MLLRQLFDRDSWTYTYLLADPSTSEAVLIDPVYEQHERDLAYVRELDVTVVAALDTHCHADHITGAWLMKQATGCQIGISAAAGVSGADLHLQHGDKVHFGGRFLEVRLTPGHTDGCATFVADDHSRAFTGDTLLIRGAGRTDFQQGDAATLYRSIVEQIFSLPDACVLYPAHDYAGRTSSTVGEEKAYNPRVGDKTREMDFVGYMNNLGLPHPRKIDEALPANMRCGEPQSGRYPTGPTWGPVMRNYGGVLEVDPTWVAENRDRVTLVDVREEHELSGELGSLLGGCHIPLGDLRERLHEVPKDKPVVAVCYAGKRSGMATIILQRGGYTEVANLSGGLLRWRMLGLPD